MLEIKGLNAWYGESHILHGVDFEVREGEVVTLLGRNGAGKTTTMKSIMGLVPRREGSVKFRGAEIIRRIRGGRTILMVEHNLSVVEGLCDTITVLTRGRVLAEGDYAEVSKNPDVIAAYLGSEHVHA